MKQKLDIRYQVVYYDPIQGRQIYWPADDNSDRLAEKLREARNKELPGAILSPAA